MSVINSINMYFFTKLFLFVCADTLRVLAGGILNFSGTLLGELIFLAQGDVLGILVHFWGS